MWRQTEHTLSRLRSPDLQLPEASTSAISFDAAGLADELEPLVTGLRRSIEAVELEERRAAESLQTKTEAMTEHDRLIGACKSILTGFYLLARRADLAQRLRISLPRPRPGSDDEASPSDTPTSSSTEVDPATEGGDSVSE